MFFHYYGEYGARLDRKESVHEDNIHSDRTYIFLCILPLFFYVPNVFVRQFEEVSVDNLTNAGPWNAFRSQMRSGWEATTTPVRFALICLIRFAHATIYSCIDYCATFSQRCSACYREH